MAQFSSIKRSLDHLSPTPNIQLAIREVNLCSLSPPNIQNDSTIQFHAVRLDHLTSAPTKIKFAQFKSMPIVCCAQSCHHRPKLKMTQLISIKSSLDHLAPTPNILFATRGKPALLADDHHLNSVITCSVKVCNDNYELNN
jgi:hypothetical protein